MIERDQCQHCGTDFALTLEDLEENHHDCRDENGNAETLCPICHWCACCDEREHQCEVCDEFFIGDPITSEETGKRGFCSDACLQEAIDDRRIARMEAKEQFELYGDDLDSWYR